MAWTPPRTWRPREVPTAAQLNAQVRDNFVELNTVVAPVAVTLLNGWVEYAGAWPSPAVTLRGNRAHMWGLIKNGTTTAGTQIATVPAGYRPPQAFGFGDILGLVACSGGYWRIDVRTDGAVIINTAAVGTPQNWLSLVMSWVVAA